MLPKLYPWQEKEILEHGQEPKRALFVSPRLGKTRATVETMRLWDFTRALVVCPLVVAPMWEEMLSGYGYETINLYSGSGSARLLRLNGRQGVAIANYDFLSTASEKLLRWQPTAVIGDESHLLKSPSAKRARTFRKLAWQADWVRLLTGTPTPNHYGDLWGQMVCLDKTEWGTSYERFAQRYLIRSAMFPSVVLGARNTEELQARLLRYATFVRRQDAFGPDTWQTITRRVELPSTARALYDKLAKEWILDDQQIDASHILLRLVRLQQLSSGFLPTPEGTYSEVHDAKIRAVLEDLSEIFASGEKAVIFHRFRWESERYSSNCRTAFGDRAVYVLNGDTSIADRSRLLAEFASREGPCVTVVQTQAGGVGVSFAEATHALFVSRGFSFTDDEQARDRIYKPGQNRAVTYYEASHTVDQTIARVLASKGNIHSAVVNADREALAYGYLRGR